jgi:3-oxoacyl-[acyl-carrier-protein] synthase III
VGVFRSEFLTEPAIAALLAGDLQINDDRNPNEELKTLAFDLLNGSIGFLNACYLVSELARAGCLERAMIVASEVENNSQISPDNLLGIREIGTAVILQEADDGETGFGAFSFCHFPEYQDTNVVAATWNELGKAHLISSRENNLLDVYLDCMERSVERFLKEQGLDRKEIRFLLPPQISPNFVRQAGERLGFAPDSVVNVAVDGEDLATSSTPAALQAVLDHGRANKGDIGLIVNVGSGVQVACATYRF